jgi:diguanylate cyclase (GGDEF)-like protein
MAGESILIVDDAPEIRRLLQRFLVREGYTVSLAQDGETALKLLETTPFHVAVVDLVMPGIGGVQVLRQIRERYPLTDVIILTGYGELETAATTLSLGAYYYFQKESFNLNLVPLVIGRMLERQRLARENDQLIGELRQANRELEQGRRRQLRSFAHIGRALEGELGIADMSLVLGQAIASVVDCDATGVLVIAPELTEQPLAALVGQRALGPEASRALVAALVAASGVSLENEPQVVATQMQEGADEPEDQEWVSWETEELIARNVLLGLTLVARRRQEPFSQDDLNVLHILSSQGGIALENTYLFARMRDLATRDSLTGLYNHRHFYELLEAELSRAERQGRSVGVIMLDMDKDPEHSLKAVNDRLGHQAGDALLREIAARLRATVRRADAVARYGGDEFIVLAPESGPVQTSALADRLWRCIREEPFVILGNQVHLTASLGVAASSPGQGYTPDMLVQLADRACYQAKGRGRDQVCVLAQDTLWQPHQEHDAGA